MGILKIVLLVFSGLLGVVATEAGVVAWLTHAPYSLDLTDNYFTLTVLPVVVLVVVGRLVSPNLVTRLPSLQRTD